MEVGAGLNKNGMDVTIVFPEKHLMERLFTPEIAQFYEQYYQDKGVTLKSGSLATEFKGKDGVVSTCICLCFSPAVARCGKVCSLHQARRRHKAPHFWEGCRGIIR